MKPGTRVTGEVIEVSEGGITLAFDELSDGFIPRTEFDINKLDFSAVAVGDTIDAFTTKKSVNSKRLLSLVYKTGSGRIYVSGLLKNSKDEIVAEVRRIAVEQEEAERIAAEVAAREASEERKRREIRKSEIHVFPDESITRDQSVSQEQWAARNVSVFIIDVIWGKHTPFVKLSLSPYWQNRHLADYYTIVYKEKEYSFKKQISVRLKTIEELTNHDWAAFVGNGAIRVGGIPAQAYLRVSELPEENLPLIDAEGAKERMKSERKENPNPSGVLARLDDSWIDGIEFVPASQEEIQNEFAIRLSDIRSAAEITLDAICNAMGASTRDEVLPVFFHQAHLRGVLPSTQICVTGALNELGFIKQSKRLEVRNIGELLEHLNNNPYFGATVIVKILYGNLVAIVPTPNTNLDQPKYVIHEAYRDVRSREAIDGLWIRWPDKLDHSLVSKRKIGDRKPESQKYAKRVYPDHPGYHRFQVNPLNKMTGDCVVRAFAGVCEISWHEALDRLASFHSLHVNAREVYYKALEREGFVGYCPVNKGKKRLRGVEFCQLLNKKLTHGERVFAHVGRSHVAAIAPVAGRGYCILDNWDSSDRTIGYFWIR